MAYSAAFKCLAGCPGRYPLTQPIYRCPTCDGLLDVAHDIDKLRDRSAATWMKLFDERYKRTVWPYGSGVWGKREWVAPEVSDDAIVSMDEGGTNLFWAERYGRTLGLDDVWVSDHLLSVPDPTVPVLEGWTTLVALAGATERIGLGTLVLSAMLLVLEKMLRLFDFVATEGGPVSVVWRMLANLIPEYLSLGIPDEAWKASAVLGKNYPGTYWYRQSLRLLHSEQNKTGMWTASASKPGALPSESTKKSRKAPKATGYPQGQKPSGQ